MGHQPTAECSVRADASRSDDGETARRMSRAVTDYKGMKAMMRIILIGVSLAVLSVGCRQDPLAELREGAQGILDDARTRANDVRELSAAELQALWAIEYTSLEVAHADLGDVDERLNAMGRERWECYHVSEHEQGRGLLLQETHVERGRLPDQSAAGRRGRVLACAASTMRAGGRRRRGSEDESPGGMYHVS